MALHSVSTTTQSERCSYNRCTGDCLVLHILLLPRWSFFFLRILLLPKWSFFFPPCRAISWDEMGRMINNMSFTTCQYFFRFESEFVYLCYHSDSDMDKGVLFKNVSCLVLVCFLHGYSFLTFYCYFCKIYSFFFSFLFFSFWGDDDFGPLRGIFT